MSTKFRHIVKKGDKVDETALSKFLNESTNLGDDQIGEVLKAVNILREDSIDSVLKLGRLVSFDWSIRNNINNKEIDNINRLFVELKFSVKRSDLAIVSHTLSLSLPEFKVLFLELSGKSNPLFY